MSNGIYVGVNTDVPIYKDTVIELEGLSNDNYDPYFSRTYTGSSFSITNLNQIHDGYRMRPNNIGSHSTTASCTLTAKVDLKNVKVYCEYCTEKSWDKVTTTIAGTKVMDAVSGTDNTSLNLIWSGDLAAGETIYCYFEKDSSTHASGEKVYWEITCDPLTETIQELVGYENKDVARRVKKMYVSVDGVAKAVKKCYIGVEGVARLVYSSSTFGEYTGDYTVTQITDNGSVYDLYTLTSSGTLTLTGDTRFWMCGGGGSGGTATLTNEYARSGGGGGGGYTTTGTLSAGTFSVLIGAKAAASEIAGLYSAAAGKGGNSATGGDGGSGGGSGVRSHDGGTFLVGSGTSAGVSTYPFGIESLEAHCAGGGGGRNDYVSSSGSVYGAIGRCGGSNGVTSETSGHTGGIKGGGDGGTTSGASASYYDGKAATFYGGGGGGGAHYLSSGATTTISGAVGRGASGYQGVCYLLIPA